MEGASRRSRSTNLRCRRRRNRKNAPWRRSAFLVGYDGTAFQSHQFRRSKTLSKRGGVGGNRETRSSQMLAGKIDRRGRAYARRIREDRQRNQRANSPPIRGS